jgi:tRNA-specific 2-thiouridylase
MKKTVFVGLSGGVDSALSAYLLKKDDFNVVGVFMKNWDGEQEQCQIKKDLEDAQKIALFLDIPFKTVDFVKEYKKFVFDDFLEKIEKGLTPNPDIFCNKFVKFDAFYQWALSEGADCIATGHYARICDHHRLLSGLDEKKDQTYFLYAIYPDHLKNILFPIGHLLKTEVRDLAKKVNIPVFEKKDSTGICFIGPGNFRSFLQDYLPSKQGSIQSLDGTMHGQHDGVHLYTLGQRSGLNIGGQKGCDDKPWYIIKKDLITNTLYVSQNKNDSELLKSSLNLENFHWLIDPLKAPFKAQCRIRHGQKKQQCWIYPDQENQEKVSIMFQDPQRAITPGQAAVIYAQEHCLGGGTIV